MFPLLFWLSAAGNCQAWAVKNTPPSYQKSCLSSNPNPRSDLPASSNLFGGRLSPIQGGKQPLYKVETDDDRKTWKASEQIKLGGLEGALETGPAFVLRNAVPQEICKQTVHVCEDLFNLDGSTSLDVMSSESTIGELLSRYVDLVEFTPMSDVEDIRLVYAGLSSCWTVHKQEQAASTIPTKRDGTSLALRESDGSIMSKLTAVVFLNDDFSGGESKFYHDRPGQPGDLLAVVRPSTGSILVFPCEANSDGESERLLLHNEASVSAGAKYTLRMDVLFAVQREPLLLQEVLFQHDHIVREAFLPRSPVLNKSFLSHVSSLYNPHMGVENLGEFLYSFIRFTKVRSVVEIGAGYTSLWILQALQDNDAEIDRLRKLHQNGKLRLLDTNFCVDEFIEAPHVHASLLCIDNCLHEKETATGATAVAQALGLRKYLQFQQADAFELDLEPSSFDVLWCDFGVGSRMIEFVSGAWTCIRPGGFLICHSTLTNTRTRDWLEAIRLQQSSGEQTECGIPLGEFVELSLLEPHKRYQNSVTILQKRKGFDEPVFSEFA